MRASEATIATFRLWMRYFRYEVDGFEYLAEAEPALIVGYHGGPWTFDLWMLGARMYDELGYFPRAVWHRNWWRVAPIGQVVSELGGLQGRPTDADIAEIRARGEHMVTAPGGAREALRPFWQTGRVDFGHRRGYLRLAFEHDLPIIPVVATGLDETFLGLNDGRPAWLALGVGGLWPLALPFPSKIRQRIGAPIHPASMADDVHLQVVTTMQTMLDELRAS